MDLQYLPYSTALIPRTTLILSTLAALDTLYEPCVPPTYSFPALTTSTPPPSPTPALPSPSHLYTLSAYTHATHITLHTSQTPHPPNLPHPPHSHRVPRQPYRHTKEDHILTHNTHAYIITIQETQLTPKAKTSKVFNFTTGMLYKLGDGLLLLLLTSTSVDTSMLVWRSHYIL